MYMHACIYRKTGRQTDRQASCGTTSLFTETGSCGSAEKTSPTEAAMRDFRNLQLTLLQPKAFNNIATYTILACYPKPLALNPKPLNP